MEAGDVVVLADAAETNRVGLRYRLKEYDADQDWGHFQRIRQDGQPDKRERGFSGAVKGEFVNERVACMVCEYRRSHDNGHEFPINAATRVGTSMVFEAPVPVCTDHLDWVTDEFPETLRELVLE